MPILFFGLAALMAAMGSPQAGLATGPVGMSAARRARVDAVLMAIAINSGICAGAFAPTSLFGVITYRVAREAGIDITTVVLLVVASWRISDCCRRVGIFSERAAAEPERLTSGGHGASGESTDAGAAGSPMTAPARDARVHRRPRARHHRQHARRLRGGHRRGAARTGRAAGAPRPVAGARGFTRIDWSTAFVVGGIVTYVGVLQKLDAVDLLGRPAMAIGTPMLAALLICMIAALVSAFASTTGVLAALVPMAVPLAASGAVPGWALITTLGVSATIVDCSPFSNSGATLIASAPEEDRPRLRVMLLRWSMAMVVVGPLVLLPLLVLLGR